MTGRLDFLEKENEVLKARLAAVEGQGTTGSNLEEENRRAMEYLNGGDL